MLERTLNAKLTVKDTLKPYCGKVELCPISFEIIFYARCAWLTYEKYFESLAVKKEEERKWREEEERREFKENLEKEKESIVAFENDVDRKNVR